MKLMKIAKGLFLMDFKKGGEVGKLITQKKISETLKIPACYVSASMRSLKPVKRVGHDTLYDAKTAFDAVRKYYEEMIADVKLKCEEKVRRYSEVADMAEREAAKWE